MTRTDEDTLSREDLEHVPDGQITIALAGNPNSGKTTVFNAITGARQHVGNYPGVTVEKKMGHTTVDGLRVEVVDLPGTLTATGARRLSSVALTPPCRFMDPTAIGSGSSTPGTR